MQSQSDEDKFYDHFLIGVKTVESAKSCLVNKEMDTAQADYLIETGLGAIQRYAEYRSKRAQSTVGESSVGDATVS